MNIDKVSPDEKWTFNEEVTNCFDNMLERSIPEYKIMRKLCFEIGKNFVQKETDIVDFGCSKGKALEPFIEYFGAYNRYIGIDSSKPMVEASKKLFEGYINCKLVSIKEMDLRFEFPSTKPSLSLLILSLQFIPINYRLGILRKVYKNTLPGGALILIEKIIGNGALIDDLLIDKYHSIKKENNYSLLDIDRKKYSLEGVLVPVTAKWNEDMLKLSGFSQVDCFWRYLNFAGWIAIKE